MYSNIKYKPSGDKALIMEFGDEISKEINEKIRAMTMILEKNKIKGLTEILPTYRSIMIYYNPLEISYNKILKKAQKSEEQIDLIDIPKPKTIKIPTK